MKEKILRVGINQKGKDYFVGDIHGCFSTLERNLGSIGFDPSVDRLFCVGDLVDRGKESYRVLEFLSKPWVFSVLGNHEKMIIEAFECQSYWFMISNGAGWFLDESPDSQFDIYSRFLELPWIIEVETKEGIIAVLHAGIKGNDYEKFLAFIEESPEEAENFVLWDRNKVIGAQFIDVHPEIANVRAIVAGHTPQDESMLVLQNFYCLDVGVVYYPQTKDFCILDGDTLLEASKK